MVWDHFTTETDDLPPKKRQSSSANIPLDQDRCNHEMAKMIIMHDYPLRMVDHFAGFLKALRPQFSMPSLDTIHDDCFLMFLSQKQKLSDIIAEIPGGVNLTVDLWSSKQSVGYAFVSGHFVDKHWNLTHLLLNVSVVASPDSDSALNQPLAACLSEWKLEGKVSSITVNKTCIDNLRGFLSVKNQHVLNGQLLMGQCYANVLSSMAQDALADEQLIKKVRDSIKFIKTNETCGDKFDGLKKLFPATDDAPPYKDLNVDNKTRWDTSYNMLLAAYEHRQLLSCLETCCPDYKVSSISPQDWRKIDGLCSCLKVLFEAGNVLTRPKNLTANELYHEMIKLQLELSHAAMCEEDLANSLWEKFDVYWRGCFLVLAVAVVMDPRCKMQHIKGNFTELYGEEDAEKWIKTVSDAVHDLYLSYGSEQNLMDANIDANETSRQVEQTTESHEHEGQRKVEKQELGENSQAKPLADEDNMGDVLLQEGSTLVTIGDSLSDFEIFLTELNRYLGETLVLGSEDFDVLSWWRINSNNYPTLSKIAADILSFPCSTVSPDSVFGTEVKEMDNYRTALPRVTLEALLCTKDWLKNQELWQS
ncbi:zinc finger BED domain-containing protein DAYSLEEPER-like [Raphanus sativus]|uniref:Zinc finger BED domain-containing protein DAYSLEEPER-like n=1 Tax=Raphanus sativus TaxID=3726 RepID=A0A9W3BVL7_RAPSA|nr:zinc finger BED domain-containing protein DAYSLEEPER-like [Raphanus sativus]